MAENGEPLNLNSAIEIDEGDLAEARCGVGRLGQPIVYITFSPRSVEKWQRFTAAHLRERLAILASGKLVMTPIITGSAIGDTTEITGFVSCEDAKTLQMAIERQ